MTMNLNEAVLDQKLTELEEVRAWSSRLVARLEALLRSPDEQRVVHINAIAFAKEHRIAESEAIDLFLHAAKVGLVDMEWRVLCPACGMAIESFGTLRQVDHRLYCEVCHGSVEVNLDDFIQVSFSISPRVRRLAWHEAAALTPRQQVFGYRFAAEAMLPDGGGRMRDVFAAMIAVCEYAEPKSVLTVELQVVEGVLSACEPGTHADFVLPVSAEVASGPQRVIARLSHGHLTPDVQTLRSGTVTIELHNEMDRRGTLMAASIPAAALASSSTIAFEPFLTAGRVLAQNTFRRLFRSEVIQATEGIGVREVTVLFTDLKSSTALYEKIGDLAAFALVRQHFERLSEVVQAFDGAVVKTIGDAVMAVFHDPSRAFRAASRMLEAIDAFNRERGADDLVLKIGLHRGPSIAVTLNENVDYFGQTVNVAARVQGIAEGGEICFTDAIESAGGVRPLLAGFVVRSRDEKLKGVEREVRVSAARRSIGQRAA
jgi:class 3 adenylate cyclase